MKPKKRIRIGVSIEHIRDGVADSLTAADVAKPVHRASPTAWK